MKGRPAKQTVKEEHLPDIIEAYEERRMGIKELGAIYGVTPYIMKKTLQANGVPIRKRGKPRKPVEPEDNHILVAPLEAN